MTMSTECVPAVCTKGKKAGKYAGHQHGEKIAREELIKRCGPPPSPEKKYCCHNCINDSTAPNGFVCTLHTRWDTHSANILDRTEESRKAGGRAGGKIGGKIGGKAAGRKAVESGQLDKVRRIGGKNGGPISAAIERTCPYCSRTMKGPGYFNHLRACKHKLEEVS